MKKALFLLLGLLSVTLDSSAVAATARASRAGSGGATANAPATKTTAARAAVNTRTAPRAAAPAATTGGRTTAARSAKPTVAPQQPKTVAARAATQSVINTGTKLAESASATVASDCQSLYNACMDNFCMLDNFDGGRCVCSNRYGSFNKLLSEIDDIKMQAYKLETVGVEQIESVVEVNKIIEETVNDGVATEEIIVAEEAETIAPRKRNYKINKVEGTE